MSEFGVLGRLFFLAAKLLGMTHQMKVFLEYIKAGEAEGKVIFAFTLRSPITNMLWACVHSPSPLKKENPSPNTCYSRYNLHMIEIIIIQRAQNLDRIRFDLVMTQQPNDGWLKELLENGLSFVVNVSHLFDVPSISDRTVDMKHIYVGSAAVS